MPGWKLDPSPETKQKAIRGNIRSTSGWFVAVERGEEERMKQLLARGQDVNQQDSQCRWAAIYYAAWKNRIWQAPSPPPSPPHLTMHIPLTAGSAALGGAAPREWRRPHAGEQRRRHRHPRRRAQRPRRDAAAAPPLSRRQLEERVRQDSAGPGAAKEPLGERGCAGGGERTAMAPFAPPTNSLAPVMSPRPTGCRSRQR